MVHCAARSLRRLPVGLVVGWLLGVATAQDPPTNRRDFLRMVQKQEQSIPFVRGQGYRTSVRSGPAGEKRLGESSTRFLFEMRPGGRFRVDFEPETVPWYLERSDPEPRCFLERWVSRGYDGRTSWSWERASMEEGKPETRLELRSADVEARRNSLHQHCAASAWRVTLPGFYSDRGMSFAEGLEIEAAPYSLAWHEGREELVLSLPSRERGMVERWYLPRRWAYCLGRYEEEEAATRKLRTATEVLEATKLHDLFWYPTRVSSRRAVGSGDVFDRYDAFVAAVEVAHPDPAEFEPRFPGGTRVRDLVTGEAITLAAPDATLGPTLSGQAAHLRNLVLYEAKSERSWLRIALGALLAVVAVGLVVKRRTSRPRRRSGRGPAATTAVLGVLLACLAAPIRAQAPWIVQNLPAARVDNCGVNATALVAAFFSRAPVLEHLARDLGCSEWRHEAVALADLESACRALGLETKAFQQATLRDAVATAGRRRGLAVILVATDGEVAHYFVVAPGAQGLVIANPGASVRECDWSDPYVRRVAERFTGLGVVVWEGADRRECLIADGASWRLPFRERTDEAIPVRNPSGAAIRLEALRTSCGCVGGAELEPAELPPGAMGSLHLRLDPARLRAGAGNQQVVLWFRAGSSALAVTVDIAHPRRQEPAIARPGLTPSLVAATPHDGGCTGTIDVVVPAGGRVVGMNTSPGVTTDLQGLLPIPGGVLCRYAVHWSGQPGWLQVAVADEGGASAVLMARLDGLLQGQEVR